MTSPTDTTTTPAADEDLIQVGSPLIVTDSAQVKMLELLQGQEEENLAVRVAAQAGGCSGMQYQMFFDNQTHEGDLQMNFGDVSVVVDAASVAAIHGTTIDFVETAEKQGFTIENPNASAGGGCACGGSCSCGGH